MYKISRFQIYLILITAVVLHLTVLNYLEIFGAKPDLLLICVIFFGLFSGPAIGFEAGILGGFLCDVFALDFFGINMLLYGLAGLAAGIINAKVFRESKRMEFTAVFFFSVLSLSLHFAIVSYLSHLNLTYAEYFFNSVLPTSLYTGLCAIPIFVKFIDIYDLKELQGLL